VAQFLAEKRDFSLLHSVEIAYGAQPGSYTLDTGGIFPTVKRPGRHVIFINCVLIKSKSLQVCNAMLFG
jgi:hypothetical protein